MKPEELKQQVGFFNKDAIIKLIDLIVIFRDRLLATEARMDSITNELDKFKQEEDPNYKVLYDVVKADRELIAKHEQMIIMLKKNQQEFINVYRDVDARLKSLENKGEQRNETENTFEDVLNKMEQVKEFCKNHNTFTTNELGNCVGLQLSSMSTYLPRAIRKGWMQDTGEKKGTSKLYRSLITEEESDGQTD